jgi:hypothetical protein
MRNIAANCHSRQLFADEDPVGSTDIHCFAISLHAKFISFNRI